MPPRENVRLDPFERAMQEIPDETHEASHPRHGWVWLAALAFCLASWALFLWGLWGWR